MTHEILQQFFTIAADLHLHQVTIIGDGTSPPIPLEGAGLTDFESLTGLAMAMPMAMPIAEVKRCLADKVFR